MTFWEMTIIQFVYSSKKPIVCLEQKLSGSALCPIKWGISLSDDAVTTVGEKKIFVHPMKFMNM